MLVGLWPCVDPLSDILASRHILPFDSQLCRNPSRVESREYACTLENSSILKDMHCVQPVFGVVVCHIDVADCLQLTSTSAPHRRLLAVAKG